MISENVQIALIMAIPGTVAAILAALALRRTGKTEKKVETLTINVDGRMDQVLAATGAVQRALGVQEGRNLAITERADRLTIAEAAEDRADQRAHATPDDPVKVKIVKPDIETNR